MRGNTVGDKKERYYRVMPESATQAVEQNGIQSEDVRPCGRKRGVHVFSNIHVAYQWADIVSSPRVSSEDTQRIWEIKISEEYDVVKDTFFGARFPGAYIICTDGNIPPELVYDTNVMIRDGGV